ncbi:hypothetical protein ACTJJ0_11420 [Chitinophaga sp. 22321]|uniref:Uncharacterized protein n=1 Tax=Chitinophaga hostae TaxID=2831022 RepID=A0ABS5IVZ9_9BACT|nr:hypothetical protein [Chitinophaga hostae]MBS0027139.1 hypothetical protein [Chitinophaga hostae]
MFIIYQIRSLEHTRKHYPGLACPLANGGGNGVTIVVLQRYVWWLGPMMPSMKYGVAFCDNGDKIPVAKWTPEITAKYKELKATTKTPLRLWRGMIVIPAIFLVLVLVAQIAKRTKANDDKEFTEYVNHPQAGDIFYANTGGTLVRSENSATTTNDVYALFKVIKIDGDSIFLAQGNASRVGTAEKPINEYKSGFWDDLKKETTGFSAIPVIISFQRLIQYRFFSVLPPQTDNSPGRISKIVRPDK